MHKLKPLRLLGKEEAGAWGQTKTRTYSTHVGTQPVSHQQSQDNADSKDCKSNEIQRDGSSRSQTAAAVSAIRSQVDSKCAGASQQGASKSDVICIYLLHVTASYILRRLL